MCLYRSIFMHVNVPGENSRELFRIWCGIGIGAAAMVAVMNAWRQRLSSKPDVLWIGYADLHADLSSFWVMLPGCLAFEPIQDYVQQAIDFSKFENMRNLENRGVWERDSSHPAMPQIPSFKVRSGVVGGYGNTCKPMTWYILTKCCRISTRFRLLTVG